MIDSRLIGASVPVLSSVSEAHVAGLHAETKLRARDAGAPATDVSLNANEMLFTEARHCLESPNLPSTTGGTQQSPRVSIVIPAFNCSRYIETSLHSVLGQDFESYEIVIVDDGSTDGTSETLRSLQHAHPDKIRLFHQANSGSAVARNRGISEARGDLIAFIDSDDIWLPLKLSAQVRYLDGHPDVDLVCSGWAELHANDDSKSLADRFQTDGDFETVDTNSSGWLYISLLTECIVWTSTVVMRKSLSERIGGFDPEFRQGQDYDYWLRASRETKITKLASVMALYRIRNGSVTRSVHAKNYQYQVLSKSLRQWGRHCRTGRRLPWATLRRRLASTWYYFGAAQMESRMYTRAILSGLRTLSYWPFHFGGWVLLVKAALAPVLSLRSTPKTQNS